MRSAALFGAGLLVGAICVGVVTAQDAAKGSIRGVNHVGINVANYDQALAFYTKTLGIKEAYTLKNADGTVRLTYLQVSRDTFIELIPAAAGQPTGVTHIGIEVDDIDAAVARFRQAGLTAQNPAVTPAKARFTNINDKDGVRLEVLQFGPDSLQRKAIDSWK
jgi:catechol 2,3-dioxygenase-like lactoylglutathione lyase family enzyme